MKKCFKFEKNQEIKLAGHGDGLAMNGEKEECVPNDPQISGMSHQVNGSTIY